MGMPPRQYDLALDMTRLDRIVAYDPGDLTLSVEPGIPLHRIENTLVEHRQFLPLAVPFMDRATAGGTIASGVDSPLRQIYGTARDYVLGMEFVTGEGALAKSGGRVVKNVTGYDLHKLMIGALGTLGVITKINLRTFPVPAATRGFMVAFDAAAGAIALRHAIARSPLRPLVVEIVSQARGRIDRHGAVFKSRMVSHCELRRNRRNPRTLRARSPPAGGAKRRRAVEPIREERLFVASRRTSQFVPAALASSPAATIFKLSVLADEHAGDSRRGGESR